MKFHFLMAIVIGFFSPLAFAGKIFIDVTQTSNNSFPIALVAPFSEGEDSSHLGDTFASVLKDDLSLMSVFKFIEKSAFLEDAKKKTSHEADIDFASWAVLDALALVKGQYRIKGDRITLEAHLFDVLSKKEVVSKKYDGPSDDVASMAHKFANQIILALTGEPGLFESQIAFIGAKGGIKELYVMDFNGEHVKQLTSLGSTVLSPRWSKNANSIYFTFLGRGTGAQLYQYDFRNDRSTSKTNFPGMVIGLELDPISDLLATTLTKDGNSEIYLLNTQGKEQTRLTHDPDIDVSPSFSPDGKEIAFVSSRSGSAQIYKMNRDGSAATRLTFKGNNNTSPAWSPKGDKILFAGMDTDGHFDIFSMGSDGSNMVRLTYDTRNNEEPSWAPDGQMIVFASDRTRQYQLYIMRPDGSHQMQLTKRDFKHTMPVWSPKKK